MTNLTKCSPMQVSVYEAKAKLSALLDRVEKGGEVVLARRKFPVSRLDVIRLEIEAPDCRELENLSWHHRDRFDRMLIAQARQRRLGVISRDQSFDAYAILRLWK